MQHKVLYTKRKINPPLLPPSTKLCKIKGQKTWKNVEKREKGKKKKDVKDNYKTISK